MNNKIIILIRIEYCSFSYFMINNNIIIIIIIKYCAVVAPMSSCPRVVSELRIDNAIVVIKFIVGRYNFAGWMN